MRNQKSALSKFFDLKTIEFRADFGAEDAVRLAPCKDDKPKDAEIVLFQAGSDCYLSAIDELIGDCGLTMQIINGQIKPEIGYHIRKDRQRNGYAKEAAAAVRDWTFTNTPFNIIYSYMKNTNTASCKTAASWGCKQVDEFEDDENEITKVFAVSREEWSCL